MINIEDAKNIVLKKVGKPPTNDEFIITDVIEKNNYWVFLYDSKKYIETQDTSHMLLGNAPIIVDYFGNVKETGTAHPIEYYLLLYENGELK
ncbi:YrhB domain-containing protein [Terrimonas rubra]|uniref:YrhB domain-containing protein n=1 Tax=Terrimonas rubra TaxID=1035890 RepID=A0ABW6A7L4_9BACT